MNKSLVIAEKPSVASDIAKALGGFKKQKDVFERDDMVITSAVGHLLKMVVPEKHDIKRGKWSLNNLPHLPPKFTLEPFEKTESRLKTIVRQIKRKDIDLLINACDAAREGELIFTEATYDSVAASSFDDISTMLSAGTNNQSRYDGQSQGLATDAVIKLETLTDSISGIFVTRTASAQTAIKRYEADLTTLETRMEAVYQRYLQQFTVMESLVNTLNSTRESMTTTWENMANFGKD